MARSFNGSSGKILLSDSAMPTGARTISAWMKTTYNLGSGSPKYQSILYYGTATNNEALFFSLASDDYSFPGISNGFLASQYGASIGSLTSLNDGIWHHLALTIASPGSGSVAWTCYVDGSQVASAALTTNTTPGGNLYIGYDPVTSPGYFSGSIAEVAVWGSALSADQIFGLAKGVRPYRVRPASLKGYWPLFGLQSPEPDLSGNSNNGTLTGTSFATHAPVTQFTPKRVEAPYVAAATTGPLRNNVYLPPIHPSVFQ